MVMVAALVILQVFLLRSFILSDHERRRQQEKQQQIEEEGQQREQRQQQAQQAQQQYRIQQAQQQPLIKKQPSEPKDKELETSSSSSSSSSSSLQLAYDTPPNLELLPQWIREYLIWHDTIRKRYPGMELFTNPNAPKLLIRTCLGLCGGLHDRLGQLPWDLYLANATGRVLLLAWQRPRSLEEFLVPNIIDWSVPTEAQFGFDDIRRVRDHTEFFQGYPEAHPTDEFWNTQLDQAIQRATTGEFQDVRILRHRILGHLGQDVLEQRLAKMDDDNHRSLHQPPVFGTLFWTFFKPSAPVDAQIRSIYQELKLTPYDYTAVHCRVRHPKAFDYGKTVLGKNNKYPADKTGLPWEGPTRQAALVVATMALKCANTISKKTNTTKPTGLETENQSKIYFLSDSNDLVRHVAVELQDPRFVMANHTEIDQDLYHQVAGNSSRSSSNKVVARDVTLETAHLDRQKGRSPEHYYSTFVDLVLVMHAHCVVYGIGYYAAFGVKLKTSPPSGSESCSYIYQAEKWHSQAEKQAQPCPE